MDHVVAIDCRQDLVLDPVEKVALDLRQGVLNGCVGDESALLRVEQVRSLVLQKMAKKKRKNRRNPRERLQKQARRPKTGVSGT